MSKRVYGWDQDPATDRFLYRCSDSSAQHMVDSGAGEFVTDRDGLRAVYKFASAEVFAKGSANNSLIPFGRGALGQITDPPTLNYPVPAVGDYRRSWRYAFMNRESREAAQSCPSTCALAAS